MISHKYNSFYYPVHIDEYNIYDIIHNDNNKIILIVARFSKDQLPLNIIYNEQKLDFFDCKHKHTFVYYTKNEVVYKKQIELLINGKNMLLNVSKYPEFKDEIIMSTLVKNENKNIRQWITFHLSLIHI